MMRKNKLLINTISSLANQVIVAVCGLILPRAILIHYGSEVNGLLSSITQFLGLIAFMELGVGAVVQSAMYKPLATNDELELSKIMISARNFFRKISIIFLISIAILTVIFPLIINNRFDFLYTASLIVIIAISSFAEYYFGIVNQLLLNADQKAYIHLVLRSCTQVLNVIFCMALIYYGYSIQLVKLTTSLCFMMRPLIQWLYVKKNYRINYQIKLDKEPIEQKWNGLAQHIAAVILDKTDVIVLTVFSSLKDVSIYAVYYLIVNNLRQLISSTTIGVQALLGNLWAKNEQEKLNQTFNKVEIISHLFITLVFTLCGCLIIPFVKIYTRGVNDTNYIVPLFALLITLANAFYSFRNSYYMMIKAAGHYKQTQNSAIIEVIINVTVSLLLVIKYGLIGVAIGTLAAMIYRTIYMVIYLSRHILNRPIHIYFKNLLADFIEAGLSVFVFNMLSLEASSYFQLFIIAIIMGILFSVICLSVNYAFYRNKLFDSFKLLKK